MAKSTKSYEERMLEMEKKEQESLEKAKRYAAQKKELLKRKKAEESKKRTHRLCQVGGAVESVLGAPPYLQLLLQISLAVRWNPFSVRLSRKRTSQS